MVEGEALLDPSIVELISKYGYFAVYGILALGMIGLPLPEETFLLFLGYLVSISAFDPVLVALAAFLGSITGISFSYTVGRLVGRKILVYIGRLAGIAEHRMERMEALFNRYGRFAVPISYFVPGVRHVMAVTCGVSKMEYSIFALYAYPGGLVWVSLFVTLGYLLGMNVKGLIDLIGPWGLAGMMILTAVALYVAWVKVIKPRYLA
ncbi:MAG: DedA family protein [Firmicutes bacterium]|nr:DedA family protein [Bacillota bacterium]